jgi:hypothetical protein
MRAELAVLALILLCFGLGWASSSLYSGITSMSVVDTQNELPTLTLDDVFVEKNPEIASPTDRISEDMIHVYSDNIELDIKNATWARFLDTNSMDPILDKGTNGIEIMPQSADEITVGDIISYNSEFADGLIVHRVVEKGFDQKGFYFRVKGDNNPGLDPGKIRFNQVNGVVVALIY